MAFFLASQASKLGNPHHLRPQAENGREERFVCARILIVQGSEENAEIVRLSR